MLDPLIRNVNIGAGLYGGPAPSHKTTCPNSNNPWGHSESCPCGWAKPAPLPFISEKQEDVPVFTPSRFTAWWPGDAA